MEKQQKQVRDLHLSVYIWTPILIRAPKYKPTKKAFWKMYPYYNPPPWNINPTIRSWSYFRGFMVSAFFEDFIKSVKTYEFRKN